MVRVNNDRLDSIVSDTLECYSELDYFITRRSYFIGKDSIIIDSAIREGVSNVFKCLESYIAFILKKSGIGISNKSFEICIQLCIDSNLIDIDFANYMKSHIKIRNFFSHRYKYPKTDLLLSFYEDNKNLFKCHVAFMIKLSKNYKSDNYEDLHSFRRK
ncbi:MAG: hypothetical protein ACRC5M_07230 [Anaeroplasmataceae bacterium]